MKHFLIAIIAVVLVTSWVMAGIDQTKHNMSAGSVNAIHATSEQEVCIFCHVPHHSNSLGNPTAPLWNHSMSSQTYTMYSSEYLQRLGYPMPTTLGNGPNEPGTLSRQCLSCHDGTVALGKVFTLHNVTGGGAGTTIDMTGTGVGGVMPASAANFGTDLRKHHPVGVQYAPSHSVAFGDGTTRGTELVTTPASPIKLFTYSGYSGSYVECSSCHDPHTTNSKFLHVQGANHAESVINTCTSCHDKKGADTTDGIHKSTVNTYNDSETNITAVYGTNVIGSLYCVNCHTPHNAGGSPYLLRKVEQNTCFKGATTGLSTTTCHGTGSLKNIESLIGSVYAHPVGADGNHTNLDVTIPYGQANGMSWSTNKHAECTDCHNPHKALAGTHTAGVLLTGNAVSGALTGVPGIDMVGANVNLPIWPASGVQPQTADFQTIQAATKEYQICFKCHSYWGLGSTQVGQMGLTSQTLNLGGRVVTDQAWEFNPKNRSAHPVVMTINQMDAFGGNTLNAPGTPGRYAPPLTVNALKPPWNTAGNPGNQTMYCSDCHGAFDESGNNPKGPHGSSKAYMLKGTYKNWPSGPNGSGTALADGTKLFTMGDGQSATPDVKAIFCLNCHIYEPTDGTIHVHTSVSGQMTNNACVECHVAVPHGSPVSRLIGYASMQSPYNFTYAGRAYLGLSGFRAQGANNYTSGSTGNIKKNAYTTSTLCSTSCHTLATPPAVGTYDVWP